MAQATINKKQAPNQYARSKRKMQGKGNTQKQQVTRNNTKHKRNKEQATRKYDVIHHC